jgi:hypothetical protein
MVPSAAILALLLWMTDTAVTTSALASGSLTKEIHLHPRSNRVGPVATTFHDKRHQRYHNANRRLEFGKFADKHLSSFLCYGLVTQI